ncbi:hypothetical protein ACFE04_008824 [Oxalis oulophora]
MRTYLPLWQPILRPIPRRNRQSPSTPAIRFIEQWLLRRGPDERVDSVAETVDARLESNSFTGSLRSPASESIRDLNVSNNKFDGEIPLWMSRFRSSCFKGNVNLYTQPLPVNLTASLSKPSKGHNKAHVVMIAIIIVVVVLVIAVFMIYTIRNISRPHKSTKGGAQKGMHIASVAEAEMEFRV